MRLFCKERVCRFLVEEDRFENKRDAGSIAGFRHTDLLYASGSTRPGYCMVDFKKLSWSCKETEVLSDTFIKAGCDCNAHPIWWERSNTNTTGSRLLEYLELQLPNLANEPTPFSAGQGHWHHGGIL